MKHLLRCWVSTNKEIRKGEHLLNYHGEMNDEVTVEEWEKQHEVEGKGGYLFFFTRNNKRMW